MELKKNEMKNSEISFQQKQKTPPAFGIAANSVHGNQDKFLHPANDNSRNDPTHHNNFMGVIPRQAPKRRVREDLFTEPHGQSTSNNSKDRKKDSKDSGKIDREYSLPENIPGIDLAQGLARVDGNSKLYTRILQMFITDYTSISRRIETALNNNDLKSVERLVHTVKGVAGTIGAQSLAKAALTLEQSTNKEEQTYEELILFDKVLQLTISSIITLPCIAQSPVPTNEKHPPRDNEKISNLLAELQTMLSAKNFHAESKWQELKALLQTGPDNKIQQLDYAITNFEFKPALEILSEIIYLTPGCTAAPKQIFLGTRTPPPSSTVTLLTDFNY